MRRIGLRARPVPPNVKYLMLKERFATYLRPGMLAMALLVAGYVAVWILENLPVRYPLEYRENAIVLFTRLMTEGHNPYSVELRPATINVYGIVYHWAIFPFAQVIGCTAPLHRTASVFFVVATCIALGWVLRRDGVPILFSAVGALLLFIHLGQGLSIVARPDSLGLFLFFTSLAIPFCFHFSSSSLVISIGLSILGFLTKPYFLLSWGLVPAYAFLCVGKRRGIWTGFAGTVALLGTVTLIHRIYECYFTETFFIPLNSSGRSWRHLREVGSGFLLMNWGLLLVLLGPVVAGVFPGRKERAGSVAREKTRSWFDLAHLDEPLLSRAISLPAAVLICNGLVMVLLLGLHPGNGILYYHQLLTPFLIWTVFRQFQADWRRHGLSILLITANLAFLSGRTPRLPGDFKKEWAVIEELLADKKDVFTAPHLAHILATQNKPVYDAGMTEYYRAALGRNPLSISSAYRERVKTYREEVADKVAQQRFELVVVTPGLTPALSLAELRKHYVLQDTLPAPMTFDLFPIDTYPVDVWVPRGRHAGVLQSPPPMAEVGPPATETRRR